MYIADLHIHSRFSRATSKDCDIPHLDWWAQRKGIQLLGTGDFTHPVWRAELKEQLVPAGEGVYTLKKDLRIPNLQKRWKNQKSTQCNCTAQFRSSRRACRQIRSNRQYSFRRASNFRTGQSRFTGNHPRNLSGCRIYSRTHLDTAFFYVWCFFRF